MHFGTKLALRVAVVGAAAGAILIPVTAGHADSGPLLTTPHTTNLNAQTIKISGSGFTGESPEVLIECSTPAVGGCDVKKKDVVTLTPSEQGSFTDQKFTLHTGVIGNGVCAGPNPHCFIVAQPESASLTTLDPSGFDYVLNITFASPVVKTSPKGDLINGEKITIKGSDFIPKKTASVVECAAATSASDCDITNVGSGTVDSDGDLVVKHFTVETGAVGVNGGSCGPKSPCFILATTDSTGADISQVGVGEITFTKSPAALRTKIKAKAKKSSIVGKISVHGRGVEGLKLTVYEKEAGKKHWKKEDSFASGAHGTFSDKVKAKKHEKFQVRHAKEVVGVQVFGHSASKILKP